MGSLPVCSGDEACDAFERLGWHRNRQSGSHVILVKEGVLVTLSVPRQKELDRGTLRGPLRKAEITVDEFLDALKG